MKYLSLLITLIPSLAFCQDYLRLTTGDVINCKILSSSKDEVIFTVDNIQRKVPKHLVDSLSYNTQSPVSLQPNIVIKKDTSGSTNIQNKNDVYFLDSSLTKELIFDQSMLWIAKSYKDSNKTIKLSDKSTGTIIVKGAKRVYVNFLGGTVDKGFIEYTLNIQVKNTKIKVYIDQSDFVEISSTYGTNHYPIGNSEKTPASLWKNEWLLELENYELYKSALINDLISFIKTNSKDDW